MRLIDADKLKKHYAWWEDDRQKLFDEIVNQQPTVDAEPVRHGKWISHGDCGVTECSCCGWNIEECVWWNYCPDCGARMDTDEKRSN